MARQRVLSGMRPTGRLHVGHLLGALTNWKQLQETYDCFFVVADYHALMSEYERSGSGRTRTLPTGSPAVSTPGAA